MKERLETSHHHSKAVVERNGNTDPRRLMEGNIAVLLISIVRPTQKIYATMLSSCLHVDECRYVYVCMPTYVDVCKLVCRYMYVYIY